MTSHYEEKLEMEERANMRLYMSNTFHSPTHYFTH